MTDTWILSTTISASKDHRYAVRLRWRTGSHDPNELVHLMCLYYAKALFVCDPEDLEWTQAAVTFRHLISKVLGRWRGRSTEVLAAAEVSDVVRIKPRVWFPAVRFIAASHPLKGEGRGIQTNLQKGLTAQHLGFSILVLLQHLLSAVPRHGLEAKLERALREMQAAYEAGADPSSPEALLTVPATAAVLAITAVSAR